MNSLLVDQKFALVDEQLVTKIDLTSEQVEMLTADKKFNRNRSSKRIVSDLELDLKSEAIVLINALIKEHKLDQNDLEIDVTEVNVTLETFNTDPAIPEHFVTLEEANKVIKVHIMYLRRLCREQKIPSQKIRGRVYIAKVDFIAYCESKNIKI